MFTLNTLARIESEMLASRKAAKSIQRWKTVLKILIGMFLTIFTVFLNSMIQNI